MGFIAHEAIIVIGQDSFDKEVTEAHKVAAEIFGDIVTNITGSYANGYSSFLIAPDGSKEGWEQSNRGNSERQLFLDYLKGTDLDWCSVYFDEDGITKIEASTEADAPE